MSASERIEAIKTLNESMANPAFTEQQKKELAEKIVALAKHLN